MSPILSNQCKQSLKSIEINLKHPVTQEVPRQASDQLKEVLIIESFETSKWSKSRFVLRRVTSPLRKVQVKSQEIQDKLSVK